jgi:hypothetical protein
VGGRSKQRNAGERANDKLKRKKLRQNSQMQVRRKETLGMVVLKRAIMLLLCILVLRFSPAL